MPKPTAKLQTGLEIKTTELVNLSYHIIKTKQPVDAVNYEMELVDLSS